MRSDDESRDDCSDLMTPISRRFHDVDDLETLNGSRLALESSMFKGGGSGTSFVLFFELFLPMPFAFRHLQQTVL